MHITHVLVCSVYSQSWQSHATNNTTNIYSSVSDACQKVTLTCTVNITTASQQSLNYTASVCLRSISDTTMCHCGGTEILALLLLLSLATECILWKTWLNIKKLSSSIHIKDLYEAHDNSSNAILWAMPNQCSEPQPLWCSTWVHCGAVRECTAVQ